jgi:hypothetical protein
MLLQSLYCTRAPRAAGGLRAGPKNCSIKTVRSIPLQELKSALYRYEKLRGWRWSIRATPLPGRHARGDSLEPTHTVSLQLTPRDALALAMIINAAADPVWGQQPISRTVPILPDLDEEDTWLTTNEVAERLGVAPKTITGWIARGGPKSCPFPKGTRVNYRNYWPAKVIDDWHATWRNP